MTPRRLVALLVSALVAVPLAACSAGDAGNGPDGAAPRVPLWEAERPQAIDIDTVLHPCIAEAEADETDGIDAVATRVASVVLPADYGIDPFPQDLPAATLEGDDYEDYLPTCAFMVGRGIDSQRRKGRDVFSVTIPARQSLREALPRLASQGAPQQVEDGVRVFSGREGERATFRVRVRGFADYDVVALQADGLRLSWLAPTGRTAAETAAGRRLWRDVQATLAVRSPAAGNGDADARSDDTAPEDPTYEATELEPTATGPLPGYREATCPPRRGQEPATITYRAPDRLTHGHACSLFRPRRLDSELERLSVSTDVDAPLREEYEHELQFEADAGDDSTSDLEYDSDAPGPGGLRGESLVYTAFNDGTPKETHIVQAGGVRVSWAVQPGGWGPQADELTTVLESVAVSRGRRP